MMLKNYRAIVILLFASVILLYFFYENSFMSRVHSSSHFPNDDSETEEDLDFLRNGSLPWFFKDGEIRPVSKSRSHIWPDEAKGDRIINQLMYLPKQTPLILKKIHVKYASYLLVDSGQKIFKDSKCPVDACTIVDDVNQADAVIYQLHSDAVRNSTVPANQVWIFYSQENPFNSGESKYVNWTMTYRRDSDIVLPYEKWVYYDKSIKTRWQKKNYAKGKSKKVAWFVSNCVKVANDRAGYAAELRKYIDVDIYGICGDLYCPRSDPKCMEMLRTQYKFYLAFENGNCRDYITEKLFWNALQHDVLPIVMGAHPDDYEKVAPYQSYIHVDHFSSPKELAAYLHELDKDDSLYNNYFQWKGTGEFINTRYHCRLCAMLHSNGSTKFYENLVDWWKKPGTCIKGSWLRRPFPYYF